MKKQKIAILLLCLAAGAAGAAGEVTASSSEGSFQDPIADLRHDSSALSRALRERCSVKVLKYDQHNTNLPLCIQNLNVILGRLNNIRLNNIHVPRTTRTGN